MALAARQEHEAGLVAHSDTRAQYTSYECAERLVRAGIAPSWGRTGTALGNAMAESVLPTIKTELVKRHVWRTRFDLELTLAVYIGWYNARRLHRAFNRRTPLEVLDEYNQAAARRTVASTQSSQGGTRGGSRSAQVEKPLAGFLGFYNSDRPHLGYRAKGRS